MNKKTLITAVVALTMTGAASAQSNLMDVNDLFMVGDPTSWSALELLKTSDHVFYYEGNVTGGDGSNSGRFRASAWGADVVFYGPQIHAVSDKTLLDPINANTQELDFNNMEGGDKNWYVNETGYYRIIFDLEKAKITISNDYSEILPVLAKTIYAVGGATVGGWTPNAGTPLMADKDDPYVFTYQAYLKAGNFDFSLSNDKEWDGFWIHPVESDVTIGADGLTECPMRVFRGSHLNDNQWTVSTPGIYKITLNLRDMTMDAEPSDKIVANQLYLVGDVTNWGFQPMEMVEPNVFEYRCENVEAGKRFRASLIPTWGDHFRPEADNTELSINNKTGLDVKADQTEDYNWTTKEPGNYNIRFNLNTMKVSANNDPLPTSVVEFTESDDEPSEYFTLQGIRVENVTVGGIYIQKKGTAVKKVIIK